MVDPKEWDNSYTNHEFVMGLGAQSCGRRSR